MLEFRQAFEHRLAGLGLHDVEAEQVGDRRLGQRAVDDGLEKSEAVVFEDLLDRRDADVAHVVHVTLHPGWPCAKKARSFDFGNSPLRHGRAFCSAFPVLAARFASESCDREPPRKVRAARDAGVLSDPRACASRETQAERHLSIRHRSVCECRESHPLPQAVERGKQVVAPGRLDRGIGASPACSRPRAPLARRSAVLFSPPALLHNAKPCSDDLSATAVSVAATEAD